MTANLYLEQIKNSESYKKDAVTAVKKYDETKLEDKCNWEENLLWKMYN